MNYRQLNQQEKDEVFLDACEAFELSELSEELFRAILGNLGYNATDIEDIVREHRPPAPENSNGEFSE
jgi:hypothetical protein